MAEKKSKRWLRLEVVYSSSFADRDGATRQSGKATKKAVLAYLCWRASEDPETDGWAWPSQELMASELELDVETVRRCLRELLAEGWIVSKKRRGRSVQYKLFEPSLVDRAVVPGDNAGDRAVVPMSPGSSARSDRAVVPGGIRSTQGRRKEGDSPEFSTDPSPARNDPTVCRHLAVDDGGWCAACSTQAMPETMAAVR